MIYLPDILSNAVLHNGDRIALRFKGRSYTYHQVKDRVERLAGALRAIGVRQGRHVALVSANTLAHVELSFACGQLGAVCEQYNTRLSPLSLIRLLGKTTASVLLCSRSVWIGLEPHIHEVKRPLAVILIDGDDECGYPSYEDLIAGGVPFDEHVLRSPSDPVLMVYTSGTTGEPHGVLLSHQALVARARIDVKAMDFRRNDVVLSILPMFHVTAVCVFASFWVGAELIVDDSSKPADIVGMVNRYGVTRMGVVPFVLRQLVTYVEQTGLCLNTLHYILYGGEPIDEALLEDCNRVLQCRLLQGYGMTETASAITLLTPEDHDNPAARTTVGRAMPGIEVCVVDKQGHVCLPGVLGEVATRTPTLMNGYYHDVASTIKVMREGWYFTGDIGYFDTAGYLTLVDRKNNLVITGGENVYPLEVERCIRAMGSVVRDVAVIGVPDAVWGESLAAFVVADSDSISSDAIVARCAEHLGGYKKPRHVFFLNKIERNASGKVVKDALRKLFFEHEERCRDEMNEGDEHGRL